MIPHRKDPKEAKYLLTSQGRQECCEPEVPSTEAPVSGECLCSVGNVTTDYCVWEIWCSLVGYVTDKIFECRRHAVSL